MQGFGPAFALLLLFPHPHPSTFPESTSIHIPREFFLNKKKYCGLYDPGRNKNMLRQTVSFEHGSLGATFDDYCNHYDIYQNLQK